MTPLAITLVTTAAVIHAFWNLLGKRQNPSAAFFLIAACVAVMVLLPLAVYDRRLLVSIPPLVWLAVAASSGFEAVYYGALAGAYRNGDMSLAYPLARALPTLFITACAAILGIGKPITLLGLIGIVAVAAGCLILPLRSLRQVRLADYVKACCLLAVFASLGTTGYTIVDSEALGRLRAEWAGGAANMEITLLYLWLTSTGTTLLLALYVALNPAERLRLSQLAANGWPSAVLAGLTIMIGYGMVLAAMAYASNVSYIGAFRQVSIPLGAALGIVVQKEPLYRAKVAGTAIVLAGLVLVALA